MSEWRIAYSWPVVVPSAVRSTQRSVLAGELEPAERMRPASARALAFETTRIDVTAEVQDDVANRATRARRAQFRLRFDQATDGNASTDVAVFDKATSSMGARAGAKDINFEFNSAVITRDSYEILDAVVATMNGNPDLSQVEVQGHTDERGDDAYNLELSIRRAAAVKTYLVTHGVEHGRLTSEGYGETQPKVKGRTAAAYATNRRVEFVIVERATQP